MKTKNIFIYLIAAVITSLAISCEDNPEREISPELYKDCISVFFSAEANKAEYELEPAAATEIDIVISRMVTKGAVDVPITVVENTDDVYQVPATVSFADGEGEKTFKVKFPNAGEGKPYNLKLAVEGEAFVNPYLAEMPYTSTQVTRIKWEQIKDPMVYIDGTFATFYGVGFHPMYVWAERAETSDVVKYRFKNVYKVPTGDPDKDGIFDGYPYNDPGDFDEDNDYTTIIEIDKKTNEVFMEAHNIGVIWSYGMISIGSVYGNLSTDKDSYPLGELQDEKITFGASSLYISMADYKEGAKAVASNPTYIYLTKDAYIKDNLKITDFNEVEYTYIEGAVSEIQSAAYSDSWGVEFAEAIDIDKENKESDYKNLFFLVDAYAEGHVVAFYNNGGKITIPANQETGRKAFGKDVFVSPSDILESSVETNAKGVDVYSLGLSFHYKDGTKLGDFTEIFFYSKEAVSYGKEDFIGNFIMTGDSQFDEDPAEMEVEIAEGDHENTFILTGVDFAEEIIADFDLGSITMSIAPQELADFEDEDGVYDATLYTTDFNGEVSGSAKMNFTFNMQGNLVLANDTEADGYLIRSEAIGGWVDGYYGLVFTPIKPETKSALRSASSTTSKVAVKTAIAKRTEKPEHNFSIQGKTSPKALKKNVSKINF